VNPSNFFAEHRCESNHGSPAYARGYGAACPDNMDQAIIRKE